MEMKNYRNVLLVLAALALTALLAGCVPGDGSYIESPAGFFSGLWHGFIALITFLMGLFTGGKYTIYEAFNKGWTYNLGYLIGISSVFGGGIFASRKKSE
jgi:hypothetical protein